MTARSWFALMARQNPDLCRLIYDFNLRPQHWLSPAETAALPHAKARELLARSSRGQLRTGRWLSQQCGLPVEGCWDFVEPRRRLVLLRPETLERLACYAGAVLHAPQLARIIGRTARESIVQAIGDGAYQFALRRGAKVGVPTMAAANGAATASSIPQAGWRTMALALSGEAPSLHERFLRKVPAEMREALLPTLSAALEPAERDLAWGLLARIGTEIFTPLEAKCFA